MIIFYFICRDLMMKTSSRARSFADRDTFSRVPFFNEVIVDK